MKQFLVSLSCSALLACSGIAQAIESLAFEVLETHDDFEIRQYAPHLLATVRVEGKFDEAGSQAFDRCSTTSAVTIAVTKKSP